MTEKLAEQTEDLTKETVEPTEAVKPDQEAEIPEIQSDEEKIAALQDKVAELNDQYLRKVADFENFRKRMNREKQEAINFANQALLLDLIPIIDDLERAIKAAETAIAKDDGDEQGTMKNEEDVKKNGNTSQDFINLYDGIAMIERRLLNQLENKWGLKRFDSAGEIFDPNRHEAIMMDKSADITEPAVQEDFIKGYTLKDRVIRSAKVKVLMPDAPAPQEANLSDSVNTESKKDNNTGTEKAGVKDTGKKESK
jgi:molecular chaperone GrpE